MSKILENIVDGAIKSEFEHIQDKNLEDMKDLKEYDELGARCSEIYRILEEQLPKEYYYLIIELDEKIAQQLCSEIKYYFRKGVKAGLTDLKYLKEAQAEIIML